MIARFSLAFLISAATTLALLVGMQGLIATGKSVFTDDQTFSMIDFVRVKKDQQLETKETKVEPPRPQNEPPPEPTQDLDSVEDMDSANFGVLDVGVSNQLELDAGFGFGSGDGEYLPIVKVAPEYPRKALSRGIEGWVIVEYTVTKNGSIRDPVVVDAKPKNIFNRAALKAAIKFKYKPRVIDGQAIEVPGVQNIFKFVLDD